MIKIISAKHRHFGNFGWLKTYWLFSFSDYYDPENIQFCSLRVFNDDVIETESGFPTHPHSEMEIVTVMLEGEMTHKDNMGNSAVIKAGDVQRMSAGTGIKHSEFNLGDKPVHLFQIWIYPDENALKPSYDQRNFAEDSWRNKLLPVASGQGFKGAVIFHTDATIYRAGLEVGHELIYDIKGNRGIFIYNSAGNLKVNNRRLYKGDQARIEMESQLKLESLDYASFVLIDVASCRGWGYDKETLSGGK